MYIWPTSMTDTITIWRLRAWIPFYCFCKPGFNAKKFNERDLSLQILVIRSKKFSSTSLWFKPLRLKVRPICEQYLAYIGAFNIVVRARGTGCLIYKYKVIYKCINMYNFQILCKFIKSQNTIHDNSINKMRTIKKWFIN